MTLMGSRTLKQWLNYPLMDIKEIERPFGRGLRTEREEDRKEATEGIFERDSGY